jgi:hypothetical protein
MKLYKFILAILFFSLAALTACRDESLYPLPYDNREVGAYLRMYSIASNVIDLNNTDASGFETTFEIVDKEYGNLLREIEFYATFRVASGLASGQGITNEVFVKTVPASVFTDVPEPTYSEYKRATIRVTYAETLQALTTGAQVPPPPPPGRINQWPSLAQWVAMPGTVNAGDQIVYRWKIRLTNGQEFSVFNPQNNNALENNTTANITGGQYYSSPFQFTMTARTLLANSFIGQYRLDQVSLFSPNHSVAIHLSSFPSNLNETLFENGQTVTLAVPTNGLSTQREFQVSYRGQNTTMRINFEQSDPLAGQAGANITAALTTLGLSLSAARPRGSVFVQLQNSAVGCSAERELFWVTPTAGIFGSTARGNNPAGSPVSGIDPAIPGLPAGLPQGVTPNRGIYFTDSQGTTAGDVFYIVVDDDCDEYGRRNGYCTWTRRVVLRLTKL